MASKTSAMGLAIRAATLNVKSIVFLLVSRPTTIGTIELRNNGRGQGGPRQFGPRNRSEPVECCGLSAELTAVELPRHARRPVADQDMRPLRRYNGKPRDPGHSHLEGRGQDQRMVFYRPAMIERCL